MHIYHCRLRKFYGKKKGQTEGVGVHTRKY